MNNKIPNLFTKGVNYSNSPERFGKLPNSTESPISKASENNSSLSAAFKIISNITGRK